MHELGLCADVVEAVERRAQGRPVARVKVRVGCFHHVHPEAFDQSFAVAAAGGTVEGAQAELVVIAARATCAACGHTCETGEPLLACPACGGLDVELSGGDELILESIEYREEGQCASASPLR